MRIILICCAFKKQKWRILINPYAMPYGAILNSVGSHIQQPILLVEFSVSGMRNLLRWRADLSEPDSYCCLENGAKSRKLFMLLTSTHHAIFKKKGPMGQCLLVEKPKPERILEYLKGL